MPDTTINAEQARALLRDYVQVCNRAIRQNAGKTWFRAAKEASKLAVGDANFRTIVYEGDPNRSLAEVILHFDADQDTIRIAPDGTADASLSWKVSTDYLRDVVENRPEWYVANPLMLDWKWLSDRVGRQIGSREGEPLAFGFLIGLAFACAASLLRPRHPY
jgi:hypothetical protein